MAKFTHMKSKNQGKEYPIEFKVVIETEDDLRALYGYLKFPTKTVARYYNQSGRSALGKLVSGLPKSCMFKKVAALARARKLTFETKV